MLGQQFGVEHPHDRSVTLQKAAPRVQGGTVQLIPGERFHAFAF